jgi:hypothetical protein
VLAAVDGHGHQPEAAEAPAGGVRGHATDHEVLGMTLHVRPDATATHQRRARPADEDVGW